MLGKLILVHLLSFLLPSLLAASVNFIVHDFYPIVGQKSMFLSETAKKVDQTDLPAPYQILLTQPLLTLALENYYLRTPKIEKIYEKNDKLANTYSRVIIMLMDSNKGRDNVKKARLTHETVVVELALIIINFKELSAAIRSTILHSDTPFGKLLQRNKIEIESVKRQYFSIVCNPTIAKYLNCAPNKVTFGRTNTLLKKSNGVWVARVVEILSGSPLF